MEHVSDGDTSCNWCAWYSHQKIGTGAGGLGNQRTSGDHPNYSIVEIDQNPEKSSEVETCNHTNSRNKPSASTGRKNSQKRIIIIIMIIIIMIFCCRYQNEYRKLQRRHKESIVTISLSFKGKS